MAAPAKLYVGNLKANVTEGDLDSLFRTYGRIRQIWVARKPHRACVSARRVSY